MSNVRKFSIAKLSGILVGAALVAAPLSGGGPAFAATGCGIGQNVGSCLGAQTEGSGQWQPAAISLQTITSAGTVSITGCQGQLKFLKNGKPNSPWESCRQVLCTGDHQPQKSNPSEYPPVFGK